MASKEAIIQAYSLISANAPLVKAQNEKDLAILLRSWTIVFEKIDDETLGIGVKRFINEITEVNRSMVISAKLKDLCKKKEIPFNEYDIVKVVAKLRAVGRHDTDSLLKIKKECDPLIWETIEIFGVDFIFNLNYDQLATVNSQLRDAYRLAHKQNEAIEHNKRIEELKDSKKQMLEADL